MSDPTPTAVSRTAAGGLPGWPLLVAAALAGGGCLATGGRPDLDSVASPKVTLGGDGDSSSVNRTIPLELTILRCAADDEILGDELWQFVDEQALAADLRGRLAANGLRAGITGSHLPARIAARFAAAATPDGGSVATDAVVSRRLMRLLPGRRAEIVTNSGVGELVLLEQTGGEVRGATYRDASSLFAIEAEPAANGRVHVTLTPEIRHGPIEKSWVGEEGMFRLEAGQRRHALEELRFALTLPHDGMLVVGCGGDGAANAGDCLLRDRTRGDRGDVRLLAIRPLADAVDPLFAPAARADDEEDDAPLVIR